MSPAAARPASPGGGRSLSLGGKLLVANLIVFLAFAAVIGLAARSFRRIEGVLANTVSRDVDENLQNSALLKDLSGVFAEANLLASTFLVDEEALATRGHALLDRTDALQRRTGHVALASSLGRFSQALHRLLDGCAEVNLVLRRADREEQALTRSLGSLEQLVSDAAVAQILAGEDSVMMEQLNALVAGYRETFLQVNSIFLRTTLESARNRGGPRSTAALTSLVDDLELRFRTLTASEPRIAAFGPRLVRHLRAYRADVVAFFEATRVLDERLAAVERAKSAVVVETARLDDQIASSTQSAQRSISAVMREGSGTLLAGSFGVIVLLVGLSMIFIELNVRRPMAALASGLDGMREGRLGTRVALGRSDEWGDVEEALNRMAADLDASYAELRDKNRALEATQRELFAKMQEVLTEGEARRRLEDQLRHAQKMEAVGTLAGGIAHDFNNILSVIVGCASILRMELEEQHPLRSCVDDIQTSSERATALTKDLLAFSRRQVIRLEPVRVDDVVIRVEKLLLRLVGEGIELETALAAGELTVLADTTQLEQVLLNLAANARDAMPTGGRLTIRTGRVELGRPAASAGVLEPGTYAAITLSDTGVGMDEATRARVFEPFFTTKDVGKGTGLGLSMAYGIVKQHRGDIEVHSSPGQGTTFRILLGVTSLAPEPAVERAPPAAPRGGSETILVAEDDPAVRRLIARVLTQFGYQVIEAEDGEDAVRKFLEHRDVVALAVVDVMMPRKNGRQASEEMRRVKPDLRVLFSSGYAADLLSHDDVLEEGTHFVAKPVAPEALLTKVRELLG